MRTQIYQILYSDSRPFAHHVVKGLFLLAVGAVAAVAMIETLPRFDQTAEATMNTVRAIAMVVLTVEFIVRFWVAPEGSAHTFDTTNSGTPHTEGTSASRFTYLVSPLGLVDLLAVLPAWVNLLHPVPLHWFELAAALSLFKLARYVPALSLVTTVVVRQVYPVSASWTV